MTYRVKFKYWQATVVGAAACALVIGTPMIPVATASPASVVTPSATAVGNTYGGVTSQGMPVFVTMNATRRQVVRDGAGHIGERPRPTLSRPRPVP